MNYGKREWLTSKLLPELPESAEAGGGIRPEDAGECCRAVPSPSCCSSCPPAAIVPSSLLISIWMCASRGGGTNPPKLADGRAGGCCRSSSDSAAALPPAHWPARSLLSLSAGDNAEGRVPFRQEGGRDGDDGPGSSKAQGTPGRWTAPREEDSRDLTDKVSACRQMSFYITVPIPRAHPPSTSFNSVILWSASYTPEGNNLLSSHFSVAIYYFCSLSACASPLCSLAFVRI